MLLLKRSRYGCDIASPKAEWRHDTEMPSHLPTTFGKCLIETAQCGQDVPAPFDKQFPLIGQCWLTTRAVYQMCAYSLLKRPQTLSHRWCRDVENASRGRQGRSVGNGDEELNIIRGNH